MKVQRNEPIPVMFVVCGLKSREPRLLRALAKLARVAYALELERLAEKSK